MSLSIQYSDQSFKENFRSFCIVGIIIFVCALAGILGRPLFFLAIFWPANAVLLGLFLRYKNSKKHRRMARRIYKFYVGRFGHW